MDERKWESNIISYITDTMIKKEQEYTKHYKAQCCQDPKEEKTGSKWRYEGVNRTHKRWHQELGSEG